MIGRLLEIAEHRPSPMIVLGGVRPFLNVAAKRVFGETLDPEVLARLLAARDEAAKERRIVGFQHGEEGLQVVPLTFEADDSKLAVATANLRIEEFPALYADIVGWGSFASRIVHLLPHAVVSARVDGRVDFISRRWKKLTGRPVQPPSILSLAAAIPEAQRESFVADWRRGIERGAAFRIEAPVETNGAALRWQAFDVAPIRDKKGGLRKWLGTIIDIDDFRRAAKSIEESEARLRFLEDAGRAVAESLDSESVATVACRELVGPFADAAAIECTDAFDKNLAVGEGRRSSDLAVLRRDVFGLSAAGLQYSSVLQDASERCTLMTLPIRSGQRPVGLLTMLRNPSRPPLDGDDLAVLSIFARRIGSALENARLYSRQRRVAETLQDALLPQQLPLLPGIQFDSLYLPNTDEANVGGDWYDAFELGEGRSAVSIGDVTGHGLSAASIMGTVRTAIRSAAFSRGTAAEVLARANRLLYSESRTMVTALFGIIDRANATFRYAVAGHPPPLIVKSDGSVRDLALGGPPLGIIPELTLDDRCEPLRLDETLLLYTDGIIEFAHDAIAGERRLHDCAARWARGGRLGGVAGLAREVLGQSKPGDDIAMLAVTLLPDDVIDVTVPAEPRHSSILRETVREFAEGCKLAKSRVDDLILSVGEAVNNAILHAYEERGGTVRVRAKREASKIVVEVLDSGCWRAAQAHPRSAQLDENGRGLLLMRSLVDAEVDAGVGGTRVTLTVQ